jgi:hypothetical protein
MADHTTGQVSVQAVERPLNLVPVGLKEAALDSPTFRATAVHFADQVEIIEKWLDGYVRAASKLVSEVASLESLVNSFLAQSAPPSTVSEAVLDHDYTLLALTRYGEGAREFWQSTLQGMKKYDTTVVDPIKAFLSTDLRQFKDARRAMEGNQKAFDAVIARYLGQNKSKEPSSLREDAFQVHEARRAYLKSAMDFCMLAPQLRTTLDKMIVKVFSEQYREMRNSREANSAMFAKSSAEMERVRGWSREMENSERAFKRELVTARRQIEDSAEQLWRPSRELEDYSASTVPYLGTGAASATSAPATAKPQQSRADKQGWLYMKTLTGKPTRTIWSRRWFFVKNGIFGWLIQGPRSGGVEESEKIGVLLCNARPAFQEERRFCFEVKTRDTTITLQAETQGELTEWLASFDLAKRKAFEDPASTEANQSTPGVDPAFAISPPISEFAAKSDDRHTRDGSEDVLGMLPERAETMGPMSSRASVDVNPSRRVTSLEKEGPSEGTRERIISKLDLHKRSAGSGQHGSGPQTGGIASLISASHNILPVGPGAPPPSVSEGPRRVSTMPVSSLAPSTLANPPAPTNLSHTAVVVSGERKIKISREDGSSMPSGILANLWGSTNWGVINRLGDDSRSDEAPQIATPISGAVSKDDSEIMDSMVDLSSQATGGDSSVSPARGIGHRKTLSVTGDITAAAPPPKPVADDPEEYPNYYPLPLKAQHAQFKMLFPSVPSSEKVVLVFRAAWNPNEQQEFPGRVYVTTKEIYFYSNHLGLVLITGVSLRSIEEVTAAPGRDCDFLYLHLKESSRSEESRRITIKTFLEPLRLLQRRLSYLVHNVEADIPARLDEVLRTLIKMEVETPKRSSSVESWEDVRYPSDEAGMGSPDNKNRHRNLTTSLRIDGNLYGEPAKTGKEIQKFKLPNQAVVYAPQGMHASISREFSVSAKALFHVMFGDKSAVFQLLYCNRWGETITQTPWAKEEGSTQWTRKFSNEAQKRPVTDAQVVDIYNDHLCYVVTNNKYPWRLPYGDSFNLATKLVITHTAKSRCKLAVYQQVRWTKPPSLTYFRTLIEAQALNSLEADALDLTNVAMDQVAKLGKHSKTNKAVDIFGGIGQQVQVPQIDTKVASAMASVSPGLGAKRAKKQSLYGLIMDDAFRRVIGMITVVVDILLGLSKAVLNVFTAHTLLVALLATSVIYNSWHSYRDGMVWYNERNAGKFMSRLGVTPNPSMSRSIFLNDVETLIAPSVENDTLSAFPTTSDTRTCRTTFGEQLSPALPSTSRNQVGRRLDRTRDSIARYRHDLLVALRVVNRVERDVVLAAWEDWVRAEEKKCVRLESMIRGKKYSVHQQDQTEEIIGKGFEEYCSSCRVELEGIGNGTELI